MFGGIWFTLDIRKREREDDSCFAMAEMTFSSSSESGLDLRGSGLSFAASSITSRLDSSVSSLDSHKAVGLMA